MELRHIEYAQAIARHSSFTRAAEELHVAQPALSVAIRNLEAELGVRLFDRGSRHVRLTDAGAVFIARANRVTEEIGSLAQEMHEYAGGERGVLRVSVWYDVEPSLLPYLADFVPENPLVTILTEELPAAEELAALRRGDIDLATVDLYAGLDLGEIEHVVLRREPYVLAVPPDHPLAGRESVAVDDLGTERLIATRRGSPMREGLERIVQGHGDLDIGIETNGIGAALASVSAGLGATLVTPAIAEPFDSPRSLVPLADVPSFVLGVAWRSGPHRAVAQRAIDQLRERACESSSEAAA